ncbi:MAG: hypothetical protein BWK80_37260 [Desulfobacteraceae bacterium IS3]|nr:MAG: hypothetical protein BWK80_37260 [Desulfobacteraceae bacterium IS3]
MAYSRLKQKADIAGVRKLHRDGILNDAAFFAASRVLMPASVWAAWADRMLLFFGSALLLSGVIFFFAYNWAAMGRFLKFALIESGIVVCVIASYVGGIRRIVGKVFLLSASVLVGVLLAVYGQTYQTGADAFELFLCWAVLIFGWAAVSDFAALWFVWLVIANTGIILYWYQVGGPYYGFGYESLCLLIAALNGFFVFISHFGSTELAEVSLLTSKPRWFRAVLLAATLAALSLPTIDLMIDSYHAEDITILCAVAWALTAGGAYFCYRRKLPDMVPLAIIVTDACVILLVFIGKILLWDGDFYTSLHILFFALIVLGVTSAAAFRLRKTARDMAAETKGTES